MNKDINNYDYDIALSFARENREYVRKVAELLVFYNVKVFYDEFEEANLWGKNLYDYLHDIYKNKAKFTIIFISKSYAEKVWTNHERKSAQERAFVESREYILPARFDETEIPGLPSTVSYIDLNAKMPEQLAKIILKKINLINRWWGKWELESDILSRNIDLDIYESDGQNFFKFNLNGHDGGRLGNVRNGIAKIISSNEALFESDITLNNTKEKCYVKFYKLNDKMQIIENNCHYFHGIGMSFTGNYILKKDIFYSIIHLNDILLSKLYSLLKKEKYWNDFLKCFGGIGGHTPENEDDFQAKIIFSFVRGMHSQYQAILMYSETNNAILGAFLNAKKIYYFSSENKYKKKLPKTIENWKNKLNIDKEIIFL